MGSVVAPVRYRCRGCDARLTGDLVEVDDPGPAVGGRGMPPVDLPPTMATQGTWALTDRRAFASEWVAERSDYPPSVPQPQVAVLLDEGDLVPDLITDPEASVGCCGIDGHEGPNLRCPQCGAPVGVRFDDCWTPMEVRLDPAAVYPAAVYPATGEGAARIDLHASPSKRSAAGDRTTSG